MKNLFGVSKLIGVKLVASQKMQSHFYPCNLETRKGGQEICSVLFIGEISRFTWVFEIIFKNCTCRYIYEIR